MKIVKPYGETRVAYDDGRALNRQFTSKFTGKREALQKSLANDADAYMAVWVSTIDKIFGKPQKPMKGNKLENHHATAKNIRESLLKVAWEKVQTELNQRSSYSDECQAKWAQKAKLSNDSGKDTGCLGGKYFYRFWNKPISALVDSDDKPQVIEDITNKIKQFIDEDVYFNKPRAGGNFKQGLQTHQVKSVEKNLPTPSFSASIDVEAAEKKYLMGDTDPIAKVYEASKNQGKTKTKAIIFSQLFDHYAAIFGKDTKISTLLTNPAFQLHLAIKAAYKKLLSRPKITPHQLPKNWDEMKRLIINQNDNQDINALIRQGKVIYYQWLDELNKANETELNFKKLTSIKLESNPFWTSMGQFKIKNDEAFIRVWRHCLSLANFSFAQWVDGENERKNADIIPNFERTLDNTKNHDYYVDYAEILFGDAAQTLGFGTSPDLKIQKTHLKYTKELLTAYRNQVFHFKGLSSFMQAAGNISCTQPEPLQSIKNLYQEDLKRKEMLLAQVLRGLQIDKCLTLEQIKQIVPLISDATVQGENATFNLPLPNFMRLWTRSVNVIEYKKIFGKPPPRGGLNNPREPWHQCRHTLLKMVYENGFTRWLAKEDTPSNQEEILKWLQDVCQNTTERAHNINGSQTIISKASQVLQPEIFKQLFKGDNATLRDASTKRSVIGAFLSKLNAETQRLSESPKDGDEHRKKVKTYADAIEELKLDFFAYAFQKYMASDSSIKTAFEPLTAETTAIENSTPAGWESVEAIFTARQTSQAPPAPDSEAQLYYLLHFIPNDAVSLLLHQMQKWQILQNEWQYQAENTFGVIENQETFVKSARKAMQLYLLVQKAKYQGGLKQTLAEKDENWLKSFYQDGCDIQHLFSQANAGNSVNSEENFIPRRFIREMRRYGYGQQVSLSTTKKISSEQVQRFLKQSKKEGLKEIERLHDQISNLHETWVNEKKTLSQCDEDKYRTALNELNQHKHLRHTVLLFDEHQRYQLVMKVLSKLLEPVHDLRNNKAKKAKRTNCKLVLILRSQFFQSLLHFSSQPNERSTTHRWGITAKECSSLRLATCTVAASFCATACANGSPV